jgi:cell division protein FtsW (lipid II flippase)
VGRQQTQLPGCLLLFAGPVELSCDVQSTQELSMRLIIFTVAGVLLFYKAPDLSMSSTFRLTSGSLMFMSGAVVVLSFMLMRCVHYILAVVDEHVYATIHQQLHHEQHQHWWQAIPASCVVVLTPA